MVQLDPRTDASCERERTGRELTYFPFPCCSHRLYLTECLFLPSLPAASLLLLPDSPRFPPAPQQRPPSLGDLLQADLRSASLPLALTSLLLSLGESCSPLSPFCAAWTLPSSRVVAFRRATPSQTRRNSRADFLLSPSFLLSLTTVNPQLPSPQLVSPLPSSLPAPFPLPPFPSRPDPSPRSLPSLRSRQRVSSTPSRTSVPRSDEPSTAGTRTLRRRPRARRRSSSSWRAERERSWTTMERERSRLGRGGRGRPRRICSKTVNAGKEGIGSGEEEKTSGERWRRQDFADSM